MKLSDRLTAIAKYIDGHNSLADIACDHGYLGIYCAINYHLKDVLLTDINVMPLKSAEDNIKKYGVSDVVHTALGDGLEPLNHDYEVISISGIGGNLMVEILKKELEKAKKALKLVLSANNDVKFLRRFLMDNQFEIIEEKTFENCHSLSEIKIPSKITLLKKNTFYKPLHQFISLGGTCKTPTP